MLHLSSGKFPKYLYKPKVLPCKPDIILIDIHCTVVEIYENKPRSTVFCCYGHSVYTVKARTDINT